MFYDHFRNVSPKLKYNFAKKVNILLIHYTSQLCHPLLIIIIPMDHFSLHLTSTWKLTPKKKGIIKSTPNQIAVFVHGLNCNFRILLFKSYSATLQTTMPSTLWEHHQLSFLHQLRHNWWYLVASFVEKDLDSVRDIFCTRGTLWPQHQLQLHLSFFVRNCCYILYHMPSLLEILPVKNVKYISFFLSQQAIDCRSLQI